MLVVAAMGEGFDSFAPADEGIALVAHLGFGLLRRLECNRVLGWESKSFPLRSARGAYRLVQIQTDGCC
jgi:hypothetical protein